MDPVIKDALRLALSRKRYAFGGSPDEESQEEFLKEQLEGSAPQYEPEAGLLTGKKAGLMAAGFIPGSGLATAAGKFPTAEGGFEPSMREDWNEGRYGSAALKAAGAAGDVASAIPVAGTAAGALLKAPLAVKMAMAAAPAAKIAQEAAPAVREAVAVAEEAKPAYQRLINPAGFYSRAHEVAMTELPEGPRTWQEMHSLMSKAPGMKKEELHWSGLHPEAFDPSHKITREEIAAQVEKNFPQVETVVKGHDPENISGLSPKEEKEYIFLQEEIDPDDWSDAHQKRLDELTKKMMVDKPSIYHSSPMHEQYTVPGGKDYTERVLTHPYNDPLKLEGKNKGIFQSDEGNFTHNYEQERREQLAQEQYNMPFDQLKELDSESAFNIHMDARAEAAKAWDKKLEEARRAAPSDNPEYTQNLFRHESHLGDINNPIVHTRNSVRTGPDGEKIWHQEEIQSDWAQQGREKGFKDPKAEARLKAIEEEKQNLHKGVFEAKKQALDEFKKAHREANPKYYELLDAADKELQESRQLNSDIDKYNEAEYNARQYMTMKGDIIEGRHRENLNKLNKDYENKLKELQDEENRLPKGGSIPTAPHVEDTEQWLNLAAKDTLSNAIENGFDKIFITGGQEQAKRWSNELRKAVDNVRWETPNAEELNSTERRYIDDEAKQMVARRNYGLRWSELSPDQKQTAFEEVSGIADNLKKQTQLKQANQKIVYAKPVGSEQEHRFVVKPVEGPNGKSRVEVVDSSIPSAKGETLSAVIGGDLAKRIMAEESGSQAMKGYRMGSEGYEQTYNRKAPSVYKKLMKQLDPEAKVEAGSLREQGKTLMSAAEKEKLAENNALEYRDARARSAYGVPFNQLSREDQTLLHTKLRNETLESLNSRPEFNEGPHGTYLHITPKMREEYMRLKQKHGAVFPAYKRGGTVDANINSRYNGADRHLLDKALNLSRKYTG